MRKNSFDLGRAVDISAILNRTGFYEALDQLLLSRVQETGAVVPPSAAEYLKPDNPRLLSLQSSYASLTHDVLDHHQWSRSHVLNGISLQLFRSDSAFLWQQRDLNMPIHYLCTYLYYKQNHLGLIDMCSEDALFGVHHINVDGRCITRDRLDSVSQIAFLQSSLGFASSSDVSVLDIGAGYGRLSHRMAQCLPNARLYSVDSIPESTFISEYYLRYRSVDDRITTVDLVALEDTLRAVNIDLAVAVNSFSEFTSKALIWWLNMLHEKKVRYLLVVPHPGESGGRRLVYSNGPLRKNGDMHEMILASGFKPIVVRRKYEEPALQAFGVSPTYYHLFGR